MEYRVASTEPRSDRALAGALVVIIGGGGFLGRYVAEQMLLAGARVRIAERRAELAHFLRQLAHLGDIQFVPADVTRPDTVRAALIGADAVVNLSGTFGGEPAMRAVHVDGARHVAEAAREAGARALVHLSAIGAAQNGASAYARSKGDGEAAVHAAFPTATILRPSLLFGPEDNFINRFARMAQGFRTVPILAGKTRFQPVFVGDVAQAVRVSVERPSQFGAATYELGGPEVATMTSIMHWIARATGLRPWPLHIPAPLAGVMARLSGWLPGAPLTHDQFLMLQQDNIVAPGAPGLAELGIVATPISAVADDWMVRYRENGRFGRKIAA